MGLYGDNVIPLNSPNAGVSRRKWNFEYPHQLVRDPSLDLGDKRAILAAWASDLCAVESFPTFRYLPGTSVAVTYSSIMDALAQLDRIAGANDDDPQPPPHSNKQRGQLSEAKIAA